MPFSCLKVEFKVDFSKIFYFLTKPIFLEILASFSMYEVNFSFLLVVLIGQGSNLIFCLLL